MVALLCFSVGGVFPCSAEHAAGHMHGHDACAVAPAPSDGLRGRWGGGLVMRSLLFNIPPAAFGVLCGKETRQLETD